MRVLIICTYFPPDTAIAAVRPYMFAKYLDRMGDQVTVICSGRINKVAGWFCPIPETINVVTCNNLNEKLQIKARKSRISFLPFNIRRGISRIYHILTTPFSELLFFHKTHIYERQICKKIETFSRDSFDVIFSTYGEAENIKAAVFAKSYFSCPLVLDLRDMIACRTEQSFARDCILRKYEKIALSEASHVTTVSQGLTKAIIGRSKCDVSTIYNGFEPKDSIFYENKKTLVFCYTGQLYRAQIIGLQIFCRMISELISENIISHNRISFEYCGPDSEQIQDAFKKHSLSHILNDHGYVKKCEAESIQNESDIFLVLSWNSKQEKGILTGKFYEGIRLKKQILSIVSGDEPMSELYSINETFHYGYCYEASRGKKQDVELKNYIINLYNKKLAGDPLSPSINTSLYERFSYPNLTIELRHIFESLRNSYL